MDRNAVAGSVIAMLLAAPAEAGAPLPLTDWQMDIVTAGKQTVERLGGKLILADVIPRPHPDLAALLPA